MNQALVLVQNLSLMVAIRLNNIHKEQNKRIIAKLDDSDPFCFTLNSELPMKLPKSTIQSRQLFASDGQAGGEQ